MVESFVKVEWYVSRIRERVISKLKEDGFVGNIKFEFNIKNADVTNMNVDTRESLKTL